MTIKDKTNNYNLLKNALEIYNVSQLSEILYVNKNTIERWIKLENVPWQYHVDLKRVLNLEVNYDEFTFIEKDQFFTSKDLSKHCINVVDNKLKELNLSIFDFILIEPSAGDGAFFSEYPHNNKIGLDIEPRADGIIKADFLTWLPENYDKPIIVIGNPPFGLRGNLALRFINYASKFSDFVCFILPPLFDSDGKGSCMGRVKNMNLIHTEKIDNKFYYPNKEEININVIFQIWSKNHSINQKEKINCDEYVKIYSLTDGGTPSTTRNKKMIGNCDFYLASSSYEKNKMTLYNSFEELPNRRGYGIKVLKDHDRIFNIIKNIDWSSKSFLATNSSYNIRTSIITNTLVENGVLNR
jgi:hypothetical protein